eukprot:31263-Pelagococcus_subviridis.AAC.9
MRTTRTRCISPGARRRRRRRGGRRGDARRRRERASNSASVPSFTARRISFLSAAACSRVARAGPHRGRPLSCATAQNGPAPPPPPPPRIAVAFKSCAFFSPSRVIAASSAPCAAALGSSLDLLAARVAAASPVAAHASAAASAAATFARVRSSIAYLSRSELSVASAFLARAHRTPSVSSSSRAPNLSARRSGRTACRAHRAASARSSRRNRYSTGGSHQRAARRWKYCTSSTHSSDSLRSSTMTQSRRVITRWMTLGGESSGHPPASRGATQKTGSFAAVAAASPSAPAAVLDPGAYAPPSGASLNGGVSS